MMNLKQKITMKTIVKAALVVLGFGAAVGCRPVGMYDSPEVEYDPKDDVTVQPDMYGPPEPAFEPKSAVPQTDDPQNEEDDER